MVVGLTAAVPRVAAATAPPDPGPPATNDFIPEDQNLSDCVGTLQRPDCGSTGKGDWHSYLAFGVLLAGMGFIGWRIVVGVRQRDAVQAAPPPE
jgi:hypothetical protein